MKRHNIRLIKEFKFLLLIPPINILADIFTNYFEPGTFNPGSIRAGIIILFLFYFFNKRYKLDDVSKFILVYIIYLLVLSLFSTNVLFSLMISLKASISFLMFTLGFFYIKNHGRFITLNKTYILVTAIIIVNLTLTNYFNIGTSDYVEGTFYFGSARVNITKTLAALFICSPLMLKSVKESKYNKLVIIIIFTSLILIFIGVKRAAILSVFAGTLIYLILTPRKGKLIKYLTYTAILLFVTSPFYLPTIEERFAAREERLSFRQQSIDEEARYNEVFLVIYAFNKDDLLHKLFGSELFNDREYFRTSRMLHTDYMTLLNGSGIIGIFFFLGVYLMIIREKNKYYKHIKVEKIYGQLNAVFWAIIISMMIMSIAGTIHEIGSRALMFMYLGAIIRLMKEGYKQRSFEKQLCIKNINLQKKEIPI